MGSNSCLGRTCWRLQVFFSQSLSVGFRPGVVRNGSYFICRTILMVMSKKDSVPVSLSDVATFILENGHLNIASDDDNLQALYSLCRLGMVSEEAIKAYCETHSGEKTLTFASEAPRVPEQRAIASKLGFKRVSKMKQAELQSLLEPYMSILQYFPIEMARRVKGITDRKEASKRLEKLVQERTTSEPAANLTGWVRKDNFLDILAVDPEKYISLYDCKRIFQLGPEELKDIPTLPQSVTRMRHTGWGYLTLSTGYRLWSVVERAMVLRGGIEGVYHAQEKLENAKQRRRDRNRENRDLRFNLLKKVLAKKGVDQIPTNYRVCREYLLKRSRPTKEEVLETARIFQEDEFFQKHTSLGRREGARNTIIFRKDDALRLWVEENRDNLEEAMVACSLPSSLKSKVMEMRSSRSSP